MNRGNMKAPWNPQLGFQDSKVRFMDSVAISAFASQPIAPTNVLNMRIVVILTTGVFQLKYTNWYALPAGERTLLDAWD